MIIVADENIPLVREAFAAFGEVKAVSGRDLHRWARDADVLVVRSVTRVDEALLGGGRVRFVGSVTSGTDHIDTAYVRRAGIAFADARGCNAESVAQYVAAVLCHLRSRHSLQLRGQSLGIVGVGHCGSRVERIARALGLAVVLCDPPQARSTGDAAFRPLRELADCDFVTLHVPLIRNGEDRSENLIDAPFLAALRPSAFLINAARGGVVDEAALVRALDERRLAGAALDVWSGEPSINVEVLHRVAVGTPHVAGYALDGKLRATRMIHDALARFLGVAPDWRVESPVPQVAQTIRLQDGDDETLLSRAIERTYDLAGDDAALRRVTELAPGARAAYFDSLRKHYPLRREICATRVELPTERKALARRLAAIGFTVRIAGDAPAAP